ncbi:MAG: hypothetical protein LBL83_13905, partial [Clostridiales bacterium]|nr:hypothetical protein [Clostridiales bacterium]
GAPAERLSNADSAKKVMEDGAVALSGVLLDSVSEIPFGGEWFETSVGLSVSAPDAYIQEFLSVMGAPLDLQDEAMRGQFEIVRLLANSELALSVIAGLNANAGAGADAGASALAPEFGASAAWSVRGQKMLSLESFFADGEMLLKIPELSEMVLKVPADLEYALDALNDSMSPAMLGKMSEYAEQASPIIERLLGIALSHIDYAEAGSETLSLGGSPVVLDTVELTITQRSLFEAGLAMLRDIRGDDAAVALVAGFYNDVLAPANYGAPILPADVASGLDELIAQLDATAQLDAAAQIAQAGGAPGEAGSSLPGGGDAADDGEAAGADSADGAEPGEYYGEYAAGAGLGGAFDIGKLKIYLKDGAFAGFSAAGGAMLAAGGEFGFAADPALGYSSWVKSSDKSVELVELHGSLATGPDGLDGDMHLRMVDAESGEAFEMKLLDFSGLAQALPAGSSAGAGSAGAGGERHFRLSMAVSDLLDAFAGKEDSAISWVSDGAYALAEPSAEFFRGAVFSIDIPYGGQQPGSAVEFRAEDAARGASVALSFGARPSSSGAPARPEGEALDADALSYDESLQQELRDDLMDGANAVIDKAVGQGYDIEPIRQAIVYGISSASFGMPSAGAPAPDYGYGYGDGDSYDYDYGDDGGDGSGYGEGGGHAYGEGLSGFDESELRDFVDTMVYSGEFSALYETVDRLAGEGELTEDFVGWYYSLEQIQRRVIIATINFEFGESAAMEQAMLDDAFGAGQFGDAGGYDAASAWLADAQQAVSADEPDFFWDAYMALAEAGAL